ncbi:MAG: hypothetical protein WC364_05710 [Eubacteriales bacterium]|jgi:hypothetical protein
MPFDANLVLADNTADWTYANLVTSNYGTPTSTTRNAGGFAVIDMLAFSTTAAKGLSVILIIDEAGAAADDALTLLLQASDSLTFANGVQTLANFEVNAATHGIILGNECPCTVVRRFATQKRYIRVDASCVADDNFHTCHVLLAPWTFNVL